MLYDWTAIILHRNNLFCAQGVQESLVYIYREILPNRKTVCVCVGGVGGGLGDLVSSSPYINSAGTLVL